jgi:hypothetical protein
MFKSVLRTATASVLFATALSATAGNTTYQDLEISGVLQEVPGPSARCPSKFGGTIMGYGASALLGKLTFLSSDCITPNGSSYTFSDGRFVITTLTGELLFASYGGQFVPTGVGTQYTFNSATFSITGGTGKYFMATGGGSFTGGEDMVTGQGTIQLKGRILLKH